ncbi:hypothetical protein PS880_05448 [Pseudomonas fluorescens]|uniref:Uncharacterized protein n=1 Tax=Pseudomonas fluorescens TaxID=294 RepID=A0A5E7PRL4_PSEFL|nr:hypothetical protein PS880_05448 [Pseudomonas fluorescens]
MDRRLVTPREYDFIDAALVNISKQLLAKQSELSFRGQESVQGMDIAALEAESSKVEKTRTRLSDLRYSTANAEEVYGLAASHEDLAANLVRWRAHAVNMAAEQLALAPPAAIDHDQQVAAIIGGHVVRAPFNLDIDALV